MYAINNKEQFNMKTIEKNRGEFRFLWTQFAEQFFFIKTNTLNNNEINTNIETSSYKNNFISKKTKEIKYHIIYQTEKEYILINKLPKIGHIFVIPDLLQKNRYFVAFYFNNDMSTQIKITGIFVYFDIKKEISVSDSYPCFDIVCEYDWRNGNINTKNSFLYNQTLLFTQKHRDNKCLILHINLLSYSDVVLYTTKYNSTVELPFSFTVNDIIKIHPRFAIFDKNSNNNIYLFDLGSLSANVNNLLLSFYTISVDNIESIEIEKLDKLFDTISTERYDDGYPDKCIQCSNKTSQCTFHHKNSYLSLGSSYCHNCNIRYSQSDKIWKCCKIYNNFVCGSILTMSEGNSFICQEYHEENREFIIHSKKINKYPFKDIIDIELL